MAGGILGTPLPLDQMSPVPMRPSLGSALQSMWQNPPPGGLLSMIKSALTLPGDVATGNVPVMGPDGHTNPDVINRAADLAGFATGGSLVAPAERNAVGAGVRAYQSVPDSLMGFRKNGPNVGFEESNFPHTQYVQVTLQNGDRFVDAIKGMNRPHAVERAYRNWDAADVKPISEEQAKATSAPSIIDIMKKYGIIGAATIPGAGIIGSQVPQSQNY